MGGSGMTEAGGANAQHYLLIDTPWGACGLAWSAEGITRFQLPTTSREATEARIAKLGLRPVDGAAPANVEDAVTALHRYFAGEPVDFTSVPVDLGNISDSQREIYAALRAIPWGGITTYGELAKRLGTPGGARAIGQAMGRNPVPVIIPCHRVLAAGGALGGFSAPGGRNTKQQLLALERRSAVEELPLFSQK